MNRINTAEVSSMPKTGTGFTMRLLMTLIVMLLADARHAEAQKPYFPESIFLPENKVLNSIHDDMTSVHLLAMKEPSLWRLSQTDRQMNAFRFLWLHPGKPQICIRLGRKSGTFVLHVAGHDGPPGTTAGRLTINKDVTLSVHQGERLISQIDQTKFWASPVEVKENLGIADGDGIVIEGVRGGRYHVIDRAGSAAGESYKVFCRSLLELADEPDMLAEWDRLRQVERKSLRYRPEPPQTEDRGDPGPDAEAS